jgi:hypothetical protein
MRPLSKKTGIPERSGHRTQRYSRARIALTAFAAVAVLTVTQNAFADSPDSCIPGYSNDVLNTTAGQRTQVTIFNNTQEKLFPVVEQSKAMEYRIYGKAMNPGESQVIAIPQTMWDAGRIELFAKVDPLRDTRLSNSYTPHIDDLANSPNKGDTLVCSSSPVVFPPEAPSQLVEYTFIRGDDGYPIADYDVSYVDHLYLPVAMQVAGGGAGYMGSTMTAQDMQSTLVNFAQGMYTVGYFSPASAPQYGWPFYTPGSSHDEQYSGLLKLPSGFNVLAENSSTSLLAPGARLLNSWSQSPDALVLNDTPQYNGILARWLGWLTPATVKATFGNSYSLPTGTAGTAVTSIGQFNKTCKNDAFCKDFSKSLNNVWVAAWNQVVASVAGRFPVTPGYVVQQLIGYASFPSDFQPSGPLSGENVFRDTYKALMRGVPSLDPQYNAQWYPSPQPGAAQKYSLDPFVWFVHKKLNVVGAYGFSLDDDQGNIQLSGANILIAVGGPRGLENPTPYNSNTQQKVNFPAGWTNLTFPMGKPKGFMNTCHIGTHNPKSAPSCWISIPPNQSAVFTATSPAPSQPVTFKLTADGQGKLSVICNSAGAAICKTANIDSTGYQVILPSGGGGGATASTLYLAPNWTKASCSAGCTMPTETNSGRSVTAIGNQPDAISVTPLDTDSFTIQLVNNIQATKNYVVTGLSTGQPAISCTKGCSPNYAAPVVSMSNGNLTINMPPGDAE